MKSHALTAAICLLCLNLSVNPARAQVPAARTEELINIADHAAQVAREYLAGPAKKESLENWVARRPMDPILESRMKQIWSDHNSIDALAKALKTPHKDPHVKLYVANRLIKPLLMAKTEVIRKAMPEITAIHKPSTEYSRLPSYTKSELKRFHRDDKASPKEKEKLQERRLEKMRKELLPAFHNEQQARLNKTLYRLMVYADQDQTDRELIEMMVAARPSGAEFVTQIDSPQELPAHFPMRQDCL